MKVQTYKCDVCKTAVKQDSNNWFVGFVFVNQKPGPDGVQIYEWQPEIASQPGAIHLCGPSCAHKRLEEFLSAAK